MSRYPESIDDLSPPPRKRGRLRYFLRHLPGLSATLLLAILVAIVLWPYTVINVPSGQVGVLWKRFNGFDLYCVCWVGRGTVLDPRELREEGLHLVWPWDKLYLYDLRLQSSNQTFNAISSDGVNVKAQISVRYQLRHDSIAVLHKFIGPGYMTSVVSPEIGSQARQIISQYTAQQVYTSREAIQKSIRDSTQKSLESNLDKLVQPEGMEQPDPKHYRDFLQDSIQILDTLVLGIELPADIIAAINRQTEQYYMIQEYKFRVEREAEESKRKQIEANGIAAFQRTVSQGISESYLRWRGIEATLALAQSQNSKIVVIGSGKDGLPIILGNVDTPVSPGAAPQPGAGDTALPSGAAGPPPPASGTQTPPSAAPSGGGGAGAPPQRGSPSGSAEPAPGSDSTADASAAPPDTNAAPYSPSPLDIPAVKAILSRISGALQSTGSDTNTGAKPNH
jgi:regulator of protease activity HflC (stomatin/prohibitin superfamily)